MFRISTGAFDVLQKSLNIRLVTVHAMDSSEQLKFQPAKENSIQDSPLHNLNGLRERVAERRRHLTQCTVSDVISLVRGNRRSTLKLIQYGIIPSFL